MIPLWTKGWREHIGTIVAREDPWDMVVVGGGVTGAGVALEAARRGLSVLLLEQRDFAWGTSGRSSKQVHGGLRYLLHADFRLTRESVAERERLLAQAPGLVEPTGFVFPFRRGEFPNRCAFNALLSIYELFAGKRDHRNLSASDVQFMFPGLRDDDLVNATQYTDAVTDDSRLVMRLLYEARSYGAVPLNYTKVVELTETNGHVDGAFVEDRSTGQRFRVKAKVVVSATGAWADELRSGVGGTKRMRPLRGSHLVVPSWRLPVHQVLIYQHPDDRRGVFIFPWLGATVIGTTDLDHGESLNDDPRIAQEEVDYLLRGANHHFRDCAITAEDVLSTWAGLRPIIGKEGADPDEVKPSSERRDHQVWIDRGLVTATGGKLTSFRVVALDVLRAVAKRCELERPIDRGDPIFARVEESAFPSSLGRSTIRRLQGYYGAHAASLVGRASPQGLTFVPGAPNLWAEVRWSAAFESVLHLDDLLLRRTRTGLLLRDGGAREVGRLEEICREELGWDSERWSVEWARYREIRQSKYSLPIT